MVNWMGLHLLEINVAKILDPRTRSYHSASGSMFSTQLKWKRRPRLPFDHYLEHRLFYDCAGWAGPDHAAEWGAEWVRFGLQEVALSQTVFATDYPQAVRDADEVAAYVAAVRALGPNARAMVDGIAAERLVPDLAQRFGKRAR